MAYTQFADSKPVASDNGLTVIDDTRNNLMAMRDNLITGAAAGWSYTPSGGSATEPAVMTYAKGTERLRATITWTSGNPTQIVYAYSSNSGSTYDTIGTKSITYDADSNVTGASWA